MDISEMTEQRNRIMIFGPKPDGTYVVDFRRMLLSGSQRKSPAEAGLDSPSFGEFGQPWGIGG